MGWKKFFGWGKKKKEKSVSTPELNIPVESTSDSDEPKSNRVLANGLGAQGRSFSSPSIGFTNQELQNEELQNEEKESELIFKPIVVQKTQPIQRLSVKFAEENDFPGSRGSMNTSLRGILKNSQDFNKKDLEQLSPKWKAMLEASGISESEGHVQQLVKILEFQENYIKGDLPNKPSLPESDEPKWRRQLAQRIREKRINKQYEEVSISPNYLEVRPRANTSTDEMPIKSASFGSSNVRNHKFEVESKNPRAYNTYGGTVGRSGGGTSRIQGTYVFDPHAFIRPSINTPEIKPKRKWPLSEGEMQDERSFNRSNTENNPNEWKKKSFVEKSSTTSAPPNSKCHEKNESSELSTTSSDKTEIQWNRMMKKFYQILT